MAAYCSKCNRYVNQYCDTCGGNAGITFCEMYACGGTMICPICGSNELLARKGLGDDSGDTSRSSNEKTDAVAVPGKGPDSGVPADHCPVCGFKTVATWKYCPECGVRFSTLARPED